MKAKFAIGTGFIMPLFHYQIIAYLAYYQAIKFKFMITTLKVVFGILFLWISYNVITTSMSDNLFKEWDSLATPWMKATLWDFYTNVTVIYLWLCYKEKGIFAKIIWLILLVVLGSIASCAYVLIQLFKLKPNEGLKELFINQNG